MKRKFCIVASILLAGTILVVGCIYAVATNFGKKKLDLTVYAPDGAPALSIAKLLSEDTETDGLEYHIVNTANSDIASFVTYEQESKNADICILPLTDASLHLSDGSKYQTLGVVTHGNFYLLAENNETAYTVENLSSLIGKKVGFVQLGKLPGLVFQTILERGNIPYKVQSDLQSAESGVVNLINVKPTDVKKGTGFDLFAMPEPAATTKINNAGFFRVGNVQELYGGANGYPQAIVVVKKSVVQKQSGLVQTFLDGLKNNETWIKTATVDTVLQAVNSHLEEGATPTLTTANLSQNVITGCGVYFKSATESKAEINGLMDALIAVKPQAGDRFADAFFGD